MNLREVLSEELDLKRLDQQMRNFEQGNIPRSQFIADVKQALQGAQQEIQQTRQEKEAQDKIMMQLKAQMKSRSENQRQGVGTNKRVGSRATAQTTER